MASTAYEKNGTLLTVKPSGRMDTATSPILEAEIRNHLDGVEQILIDMEKVDYISSGGLRVLLTIQQELEDRGSGGVKLAHVNDYILSVLDMVGFLDVVEIVEE